MKCESVDLIEGYNRYAFFELPVLQEVLSNPFILNDDVVQFSTCSDLKGRCLIRVLGRDGSQCSEEAFDFTAVESGVG